MKNISQFRRLNLLQLLPALLQFFKRLYHGFRHAAVGFLGATDDGELLTGGDALVTVLIVEADSQEARSWLARLFLFAHAVTVLVLVLLSSGISVSTAVHTIFENASSCCNLNRFNRVSSSTARNVATRLRRV